MQEIKFAFEDLKVYEKALDFVDTAYLLSRNFPKTETYGLSSQLTRAATSIALNIAEGAGDTNPQFNRFLQIAIDSVKECVVCARIARRQEFISEEQENDSRTRLEELSKMITGLQKYLRTNKNNVNR